MENKVESFKTIRNQIWQEINVFPSDKREDLLFGTWNLKDVIAHLNNWMIHDIDCLNATKENRIPFWETDIDEFNNKGVSLRKSYSWNQLCDEFMKLSNILLEIYDSFPKELLSTKIWPDQDETPEKFIQEDIDHWTLELKNIQLKSNVQYKM